MPGSWLWWLVTPLSPSPARGLLRSGRGEPLVLLHGVTGSSSMWRRVLPVLAAHHDVIVLTALGHRGGPPARARPTTISHVVDDTERCIRALGFDSVHLAGNSMGGWVALELARRGLARSVCALSPAGAWLASERERATQMLLSTVAITRRARPLLPLLAHSARFRRWALRDSAVHGDRVTRGELLELVDDLLGCQVAQDLLRTEQALAPLEVPCPVLLAWSEHDRIFPLAQSSLTARSLLPGASFEVLPDVGHVPMLDDPQLVASTILRSVARAKRSASSGAQAMNNS